ncbi:Type-2 restriction enzyme BsoBI [Escherichia coli]|nr:AvaI/BsoBI family type II restriction endonuclease [Escherichia coli]SPX06786.1 Type-2 restriction enzyme BsoBI [Escherichia coli]
MYSVATANDLITTVRDRIDGFSWQANEKLSRASGFFNHADYFREHKHTIVDVHSLRRDRLLTEYIVASCMLSRKSLAHISIEMQNEIINRLIDFTRLNDPIYLLELDRRYFLTCGDALGGMMRNVVGQSAQHFITEHIFQRLHNLNLNPQRITRGNKTTQIYWHNRRVFFDQKPRFINKSVDIIVVGGNSAINANLENPNDYICCGELKGGIDPAGADEHWKTAWTALNRIHEVFAVSSIPRPRLVFLGAAIENSMAQEIFNLMQNGWLNGAANIRNPTQLQEVIDIIIG